MKTKILILLPIIFTVGLLLGHLMLVLATITVPNPGHPAIQIGGDTDPERTFYSTGKYTFQGDLDVRKQLRLGEIDAVNEGGEIYWEGGGSNQDFIMDRYSNKLRIFNVPTGAELMSIDSSGNLNVAGTIKGFVGPRVQIKTGPDETHDNEDHIAECPDGYAMTGVSVKVSQSGSYNYWDGYLSAKCVDITGALDTTISAWNTETNGETGGKINSCSPGYVATGIQGRAGYYIKTFKLKCTKIKVNFEQLTRASYKAESERVNRNQLEKGYYCIPGTFMRSLSFSMYDAATGFRDDDNNYIACTSIYP